MMFERSIIPPQAGLPNRLNPRFPPLSELNVEIPTAITEFKTNPGRPRRILLNNFDASVSHQPMIDTSEHTSEHTSSTIVWTWC